MDKDEELLEQLKTKKQRPHIAKLLSRKDMDNFELDVLMSTDDQNINECEGFDFDTYEEYE